MAIGTPRASALAFFMLEAPQVLNNIFYLFPYNIRRKLYATVKNKKFKRIQNNRAIVQNSGYSFKPFDQNQCIFVHIPKAAGVSICSSLFGNLAGGHTTIQSYQFIFSENEFDRYFKFTFVRNPWDRVFSAYNFLKKGGMNEQDRKWSAENIAAYGSFEDFVKGWLNTSNINKYVHFVPQYKFLCTPNDDKLLVDFLGFFENIQDDFEYIKNKLALDDNLAVLHENKTTSNNKQLDYRDFYTNETREIVAAVYKKDIELLGYNFDNSSLKTQLTNRSS